MQLASRDNRLNFIFCVTEVTFFCSKHIDCDNSHMYKIGNLAQYVHQRIWRTDSEGAASMPNTHTAK